MKKLYLIYTAILFIMLIFVGRLAYLQLMTDRYKLNAFNTSIKQEIIYPNRGDIMDRKGKLLVSNSYTYEMDVLPSRIDETFDKESFCKLIQIDTAYFRLKIEQIMKAKDFRRMTPYPFLKNISREDYARMQEQLYLYPEFTMVKRPERKYLVKTAGNILGYINEANEAYIKTDSDYYQPGDIVGITGVERSYEKELRGVKGIKNYIADRTMNSIGSYKNGEYDQPVQSGKTLMLTIDYDLQLLAEKMLKNKRGAIVAIEPKTGEILALASAPTIDPNMYLNSKERSKLINDSINKPTFDRALQATYPPGSTFKMLTALAGLQMGTLTDSTHYICHHGFHYGRLRIGCHCGWYGYPYTIETAIARSCNNYFSEAYRDIVKKDTSNYDAAVNKWASIMNSFGLGGYMGSDLPVGTPGLIPNGNYYDSRFGKGDWNPYRIIFNGMGQGEILASPLQIANYIAAIANSGYFYTPHIVKEVEGKPIRDSNFIVPKKTLVDPKYFKVVQEGMKKVFTIGTSRGTFSPYFSQAGKTGTAQNPHGKDHSIFVEMAPADDPKIVIAVVVENGSWGATWAAPMASVIAEKYVTDTIRRPYLVDRMENGSLQGEYKRQWVEYLKKKGLYVPPKLNKDSIRKVDSLKFDSIKKLNLKKEKEKEKLAVKPKNNKIESDTLGKGN